MKIVTKEYTDRKLKFPTFPKNVLCQLCIERNGAVYWCKDCKKTICNSCKLYHEKVWIVMDHHLSPLPPVI